MSAGPPAPARSDARRAARGILSASAARLTGLLSDPPLVGCVSCMVARSIHLLLAVSQALSPLSLSLSLSVSFSLMRLSYVLHVSVFPILSDSFYTFDFSHLFALMWSSLRLSAFSPCHHHEYDSRTGRRTLAMESPEARLRQVTGSRNSAAPLSCKQGRRFPVRTVSLPG